MTQPVISNDNTGERLSKRLKTSGSTGSGKNRGATACERCRTRKTKCDNQRPKCGQCSRLSIDCVYPDDSITSPCQEIGERVLRAIDELSATVKNQQQQQQHCPTCHGRSNGDGGSYVWSPPLDLPLTHESFITASFTDNTYNVNAVASESLRLLDRAPLEAQGTNSIVSWSIFAQMQPQIPTHLSVESDHAFALSNTMPSTDKNQLIRLADKYIHGVHMMNPILDLRELGEMIHHEAENGPGWTTSTCLVALVCAIGAITQPYRDRHSSVTSITTPSNTPQSALRYEEERQLSIKYWGLAVKRLALAIGQDDIQAVQCLCLAGIFFMHHLRPLQAWKYFNLAGAAWHALNLTQKPAGDVFQHHDGSQSFSLMQSLYFTTWKSESELKVELDVPGPILDNVNFPHAFPLPPDLDAGSPEHETAEHERIWLYYLAEIAARHLINRLLRTYKYLVSEGQPTNKSLKKILAYADVLDSQIQDWHSSLPAIFQFEIPEEPTLLPHADDLTQVLRHRYLSYKELLCRPFVKLCVETSLEVDNDVRMRVVDLASENVRFCILKVSQVAPHFHQGIWYGLRNFATATLILSSVHLAKQRSWLPLAQEVSLPDDWIERCFVAYDLFTPFWKIREGGVSELGKLVQHILTFCATQDS